MITFVPLCPNDIRTIQKNNNNFACVRYHLHLPTDLHDADWEQPAYVTRQRGLEFRAQIPLARMYFSGLNYTHLINNIWDHHREGLERESLLTRRCWHLGRSREEVWQNKTYLTIGDGFSSMTLGCPLPLKEVA